MVWCTNTPRSPSEDRGWGKGCKGCFAQPAASTIQIQIRGGKWMSGWKKNRHKPTHVLMHLSPVLYTRLTLTKGRSANSERWELFLDSQSVGIPYSQFPFRLQSPDPHSTLCQVCLFQCNRSISHLVQVFRYLHQSLELCDSHGLTCVVAAGKSNSLYDIYTHICWMNGHEW